MGALQGMRDAEVVEVVQPMSHSIFHCYCLTSHCTVSNTGIAW